MGAQSYNTETHNEGEEGDLLFVVVLTLLGTLLMPYPWKGNSYSSRERSVQYTVIVIIRMVTIGQHIIHYST